MTGASRSTRTAGSSSSSARSCSASTAQLFEDALDAIKKRKKAKTDADLTAPALEELIVEYRAIVKRHSRTGFPEDPMEQLRAAIGAVFESWNNKRATDYRNYNRIPHDLGTAVNVQSMVFGNMGDDSGTGVAFTRDPSTGEKKLYGEYLTNAQGEDVVAGHPHAEADRRDGDAICPRPTSSSSRSRASSRSTTATCRTWSSPSSAARSTCCRRAAASAPPRRR